MNSDSNIYNNFVDQELKKRGFLIKPLDEVYIKLRLSDCLTLVNGVLEEFKDIWQDSEPKSPDYFLNPLDRKWEYSFVIEDMQKNIVFLNFSTVYGNIIHNHCTYTDRNYRSLGLAKLHIIKLCQLGLDKGFHRQEGIFDKNNNGSLILFLKMGFKIEKIRKESQVVMSGDLVEIRNRAMFLVQKEN